jgi:predicted  nucleic acid-binding Zn-ribbon protein
MISLSLYHLQQIDSRLQELEKELVLLQEPLLEELRVQEFSRSLEESEKKWKELERLQKAAELELASLETEKKDAEKKLYSGKVTNSKELLQLEKEIQQIHKKRENMDEKILDKMEVLQEYKNKISLLKNELETSKTHLEAAQKNREKEKIDLSNQMTGLKQKREDQLNQISPELIALYLSLIEKKDGTAVAKVENRVCGGCFIEIPESLIQKARSLQLTTCSSCGRILIV